METMSTMTGLKSSADVLFLMLGSVMVFAMHAGFAFLEVGTVRKKNQVNALVKILTDWSVSTVVYFVLGFPIAYGISFLKPAGELLGTSQGYDLVHFFFPVGLYMHFLSGVFSISCQQRYVCSFVCC